MKAHSRFVERGYSSSTKTRKTASIRRDYGAWKASRPVCLASHPARASKVVSEWQQMHEGHRRCPISRPLWSPSTVWPWRSLWTNGRLPHLPPLPRHRLGRRRTLLRRPQAEIERPHLRKPKSPQLETHSRHHARVECDNQEEKVPRISAASERRGRDADTGGPDGVVLLVPLQCTRKSRKTSLARSVSSVSLALFCTKQMRRRKTNKIDEYSKNFTSSLLSERA